MEEELWYMQQQSRVLQEFRDSIRLLWDDEASRNINRGLLNPHQEDDEGMVQGFVYQLNNLNECNARRIVVLERAHEAFELSEQIAELIRQVDEDIEISIQFNQQYRQSHAESQGILPEVDQMLEQAEQIGNGAPAYES